MTSRHSVIDALDSLTRTRTCSFGRGEKKINGFWLLDSAVHVRPDTFIGGGPQALPSILLFFPSFILLIAGAVESGLQL